MTIDAFYLLRKEEPRTDLRDLDEITLRRDVSSDERATLVAGTDGTVVAVIRDGSAYIVEFSDPPGTLATVAASEIALVDAART